MRIPSTTLDEDYINKEVMNSNAFDARPSWIVLFLVTLLMAQGAALTPCYSNDECVPLY